MKIRIFVDWMIRWEVGEETLKDYMPEIIKEIKEGKHITMFCAEEIKNAKISDS